MQGWISLTRKLSINYHCFLFATCFNHSTLLIRFLSKYEIFTVKHLHLCQICTLNVSVGEGASSEAARLRNFPDEGHLVESGQRWTLEKGYLILFYYGRLPKYPAFLLICLSVWVTKSCMINVMMQYKDKMSCTNTILYKIDKYVGQIMITAWNSWQDRVPKPSRRDLWYYKKAEIFISQVFEDLQIFLTLVAKKNDGNKQHTKN